MFVLSLALAAEPGAAIGVLDPDCLCAEIEPGAHADRYTSTWRPLAWFDTLEHLEYGGQELLSAASRERGRVSLGRGGDLTVVLGSARLATDLPLVDPHTGYPCTHLRAADPEAQAVILWLVNTTDVHVDAAAFAKAVRARSGGVRSCLGAGRQVSLEVTAKGNGKASVKVDDEESGACLEKALSGLRAQPSVKASGLLTFEVRTP